MINVLPTIEDQNFAQNYCEAGVERTLVILATDVDDQNLTYELISGAGVIVFTFSADPLGDTIISYAALQ